MSLLQNMMLIIRIIIIIIIIIIINVVVVVVAAATVVFVVVLLFVLKPFVLILFFIMCRYMHTVFLTAYVFEYFFIGGEGAIFLSGWCHMVIYERLNDTHSAIYILKAPQLWYPLAMCMVKYIFLLLIRGNKMKVKSTLSLLRGPDVRSSLLQRPSFD